MEFRLAAAYRRPLMGSQKKYVKTKENILREPTIIMPKSVARLHKITTLFPTATEAKSIQEHPRAK